MHKVRKPRATGKALKAPRPTEAIIQKEHGTIIYLIMHNVYKLRRAKGNIIHPLHTEAIIQKGHGTIIFLTMRKERNPRTAQCPPTEQKEYAPTST